MLALQYWQLCLCGLMKRLDISNRQVNSGLLLLTVRQKPEVHYLRSQLGVVDRQDPVALPWELVVKERYFHFEVERKREVVLGKRVVVVAFVVALLGFVVVVGKIRPFFEREDEIGKS